VRNFFIVTGTIMKKNNIVLDDNNQRNLE